MKFKNKRVIKLKKTLKARAFKVQLRFLLDENNKFQS